MHGRAEPLNVAWPTLASHSTSLGRTRDAGDGEARWNRV
jgi:hypothetical protein